MGTQIALLEENILGVGRGKEKELERKVQG